MSQAEALWPLPPGWAWHRFEEVAFPRLELADAKRFPTATHIAPNHIESGTARLVEMGTVLGDKVAGPKHRFSAGQVLYSKIRPYLAKAVIAPVDGFCSSDMYPLDTALEPGFLVRWLVCPAFTDRVSKDQGRTVLPKVNLVTLRQLPVPVPPPTEQRRIVAKLEALQERSRRAREALDSIPPLLEKLRQSILAAAFRGDLTQEWRAQHPDVEPADKLLARIRIERRKKWEEAELAKLIAKGKPPKDDAWKAKYVEPKPVDTKGLPRLPKGWCWASVEELTDATRSIVYGIIKAGPHVPGGVPYVRVTEVAAGRIVLAELPRCAPERAEAFSRSRLAAGDLLVSKDGTIGKVVFVPPELEGGNINQHVLRVAAATHIDRWYLARMIEAPQSQRWMTGEMKGIALPGVNVEDFRRMPIPVAPSAEQRAVVSRVALMLERHSAARGFDEAIRSRGVALDRAILAKAFRGELVPQDPNDEPAAMAVADPAPAAEPARARSSRSTQKRAAPRRKTR